MTNPVRLLADPETSADLQADLLALRDHEVPFELGASLAQFEARLESGDLHTDADLDVPPDGESADGTPETIEPSGVVPKGPTGPNAVEAAGRGAGQIGAGKLSAAKLLALLAVGAGAGFGALQLTGTNTPVAPAPSPPAAPRLEQPRDVQAAAESAQDTTPAPEAPDTPDQNTPPTAAEPKPPARARPTPRPAVAAPKHEVAPLGAAAELGAAETEAPAPSEVVAPPDKPSDALQREVAQLGEVRRALTTDPRRALELANRGHAEFRGGSLFQEREALALRALHALGDRAGLESRGRAFLLRYPKSSFAREVEGMLTR